jgi:hypothetical protein
MLLMYLWLTIMLWLTYAEEWLVGGVVCLELVFCTVAAYGLSQQQNGFVAVPVAWAVAALIHLRTWIQVSDACSNNVSRVLPAGQQQQGVSFTAAVHRSKGVSLLM